MKFLKRAITPPTFDNELITQQAYMLHIILWTMIFVPIPYLIYTLILNPAVSSRALAQVAFGETINIVLLIALYRGFVKTASIIQASAFWFFFTATAFTGNGVQDEAYLIGYTLVIAIAGILLGGTGSLIFTVLSLISGAFMVNLQIRGAIDAAFASSPISTWIVSLVLFPVGAILQRLSTSKVTLALSRARASEERYRLISHISSDYTFSTALDEDGNMNLNWVAGAFQEITGYTYDEYVAKGGWLAHLHPDDIEVDTHDSEILKTNRPVITEIRTFKKDRELRWVRVYAHPVWDEKENRLTGIVGAVQDITRQKQAEEREECRRLMLEKVIAIGKQVTETQNLQKTLERIWHGVHDELGFDRLAVFLYNTERNSMDRMIGTTMNGEMEDTSGIWFPIAEWANFKLVLDKPDGVFITHNYDVENKIPEGHEMYGVKDYAAVAAWAGDKPVAVICVDHLLTKRQISDQQLEALRLFAGYAGLAIENARLHTALEAELTLQKNAEEYESNRRAMLEKIVLLGQQVTEVNDLKTTIERIWYGVHDNIGFDRLAIFIYDQETKSVYGTLGTDNEGKVIEEWDYRRTLNHEKPTSFMRALERPNGLFYTSNFGVEFEIPEGHEMYEVKDFAAASAWAGDKPVAIITVDNLLSGRPFTQAQLESLQLFAGYAGLAIENSHLNATLQKELDQRQELINELENKNGELERFTYTVSHDLKSPLVTITGFLGFLEKDAINGRLDRVKSSIVRISEAAKKMQALLNDLLELSRIGRLMNAPEIFSFGEIVHDAIDHVRGRLDEADAIVEIQRDFPVIHGDRVRLVEVVQNLIENAVKYSNPNIRLRVEIGMNGHNERGCPIFYVRDNGIGIEPQYHEHIFGLFNKLDVQSEGTGIGLSLVKRIIEVHNGRIWVESETGKGATFYFSLPTPQIKE